MSEEKTVVEEQVVEVQAVEEQAVEEQAVNVEPSRESFTFGNVIKTYTHNIRHHFFDFNGTATVNEFLQYFIADVVVIFAALVVFLVIDALIFIISLPVNIIFPPFALISLCLIGLNLLIYLLFIVVRTIPFFGILVRCIRTSSAQKRQQQ